MISHQHTPNNNLLPKASLYEKLQHPSHAAVWVFGALAAWAIMMIGNTGRPALTLFWTINLLFAIIFVAIHAILTVKRVDTWPTRAAVWSPSNYHLPAVLKNNTISRTTAKRSYIFSVIQLLLVVSFFCANIITAWGVNPATAASDDQMSFRSWIVVGTAVWSMTLLVAVREVDDDKDRFHAIRKYVDEGEAACQLTHHELHNIPHPDGNPVNDTTTPPATAQYQQPQQPQNTYGSTTTYGGYQNL